MPSNQIDVQITIAQPQQDVTTLREIASALKQGTQGKISQTFGTAPAAGDYIAQQGAMSKELGLKMGGASIAQTAGGFKASATVGGGDDDRSKERSKNVAAAVAGIGTVVGGIGAGFKTLLGMSKIFQTFMGTTGKILGTAVDMMLAPLMPIFTKILVWMIQTVFPIATKMGKWLDSVFGDVGAKTVVGGLVAGFVGLKIASSVLTDLGTKLGNALLKHFKVDSFGSLIVGGIQKAVGGLVDFGRKVGGYITDGFSAGAEAMVTFAGGVATKIQDGFDAASPVVSKFATDLWEGIGSKFSAAHIKVSEFATGISTSIQNQFDPTRPGIAKFAKDIGSKIMLGFSAVADPIKTFVSDLGGNLMKTWKASDIGTFASDVGSNILAKFKATSAVIGTFASETGTKLMATFKASSIGTFTTNTGGAIVGAMGTAATAIKDFASTMGGKIADAAKAAGPLIATQFGKATTAVGNIGKGIASAMGEALKAGGALVKGIGSAIGGAIGGIGSGVGRAGNAIGDTLAKFTGFSKMGGLIGAGIGAVAIGATIGYMMWKKYKEYESGKDVLKGLSSINQVRFMQEQFGITEAGAAIAVDAIRGQKGYMGEDISVSRQGMGDWMTKMKDITDDYRVLSQFTRSDIAALSPGEMNAFVEMIQKGVFGQREGGWDTLIEAVQGTTSFVAGLASNLPNKADVSSIEKARKEQQGWTAYFSPTNIWGLADKMKENAANTQMISQYEFMYREARGTDMYQTGQRVYTPFSEGRVTGDRGQGREKDIMTALQREMSFWAMAATGKDVTGFLTGQQHRDYFGGAQYSGEEISRMAGATQYGGTIGVSSVNYHFQLMDQHGGPIDRYLSPNDIEAVKSALSAGYQFMGVVLP